MAGKQTDSGSPALGVERLGELVMSSLAKLVRCQTEGVSGFRRNDDGWVLTVEVLEVERCRRRLTSWRATRSKPIGTAGSSALIGGVAT